MMRPTIVATVLISVWATVGASASEPVCYATADAAARQAGHRGVEGFRLEGVSRDVFSGLAWATVRSCQSPERPALLVQLPSGAVAWAVPSQPPSRSRARAAIPQVRLVQAKDFVVRTGTRVQVQELSANVRMEMAAIAQGNGAVGDSVRVRLIPVGGNDGDQSGAGWGGNERFAIGIVTGRGVVEVREHDAASTLEAR